MTVGSLFSGIGGLELGLERAGMATRWQVEIDPFCQRVLAKHWPQVPRYGDIHDVGAQNLETVDLICGGFPCQDLSDAHTRNEREGLGGALSGLWWQFARVVSELKPKWVVVENVDGAARKRWVPSVRGSLRGMGYPSVPIRVPACNVGAPFRGNRVFVVASTNGEGESARALHEKMALLSQPPESRWQDWGEPPPRALGVADGVPHRMDRLRALGNAVVPEVAYRVGRRIMEIDPPPHRRLDFDNVPTYDEMEGYA